MDYSEFGDANCCIEGGDSPNESLNQEIKSINERRNAKQAEQNLDNAIDEALDNPAALDWPEP